MRKLALGINSLGHAAGHVECEFKKQYGAPG